MAYAGIYSLVVSANGCITDTSTLTIIVIKCDAVDFNIPEGFSPNGDGINDMFVIRGIDNFPDNAIVIFNRWGDRIREFEHYDNSTQVWNGTNEHGKPVPDGTYFYIVKVRHQDNQTGLMKEDAQTGFIMVRANRQ